MVIPAILHTADLHLGGPVAFWDRAGARAAERAREEALARMVELCARREVKLVLLAGDVFHTPNPPLSAAMALEQACRRWTELGARVLIAPGNHDPWLADSIWAHMQWPKGVHVFTPEPQGLDLPELDLFVAGAGHASAHVQDDLAARLPAPPPNRPGLALLHATLTTAKGAMEHEPYAPARLESLISGPFAAWALGHIHQPQQLNSNPLILYPGTPQGAHLGEAGPRGAWLLELAPNPRAEFIPLAPVVFHDLRLDGLHEVATPGALAEQARARMTASASPWGRADLVRLTLAGPSPLWMRLSSGEADDLARALASELGAASLALRNDELRPALDLAGLRERPDALGGFWALTERAGEDPEFLAELEAALASELHPRTRRLGETERREYLRGLLEQARSLALRDLWQGGGA